MRILCLGNMYPPQHLGGYELVWAGAVAALQRAGHEVDVLCSDVRVRDDAPADPPWVHRDLRWYWRDHAWPRASPVRVAEVEAAARRALRRRWHPAPDVVLVWSLGGLPLALLGALGARGVPVGAVVHDAWPVYAPEVDAGLRLRRRLPGVPAPTHYDVVAHWSCNSAFVRDDVCAARPDVPRERTSVLSPGIDPEAFAAVPAAGPWRWRLACVGRIDERKGLDVVLRALPELPEEATLAIAGGGDAGHERRLRRLAGELGVGDRVTFHGHVDDPAAVYAEADVVVFGVTWDEPFGLVPLEAMAAGRPLVATATGGAASYLADGDNALLVPRRDPSAIAAAVRRLATDAALRARLVAGGRSTAGPRTAAAFEAGVLELVEGLAGP